MEIYKDLSSPASQQFEKLLNSQLSKDKIEEGKIIEGKVSKITNKYIFLFIPGLKSEPVIDVNEMKLMGMSEDLKEGSIISVLLEKIEDKNGEVIVSASKAQKIKGWDKLVEAYEKENADFHQTVAEMAGIPRSQAKTINLGIFYGMGARKLSNELGIETNEAKLLLQEYNQRVPFVKQLANRCMESAEKYGSIRTIRGRKCRFDKWEPMAWGLFKSETYESAIEKYGKNNDEISSSPR